MKIKLINEFHGASAAVIAKRDDVTGMHYVSAQAYHRAIRKLCGVKGCACGGIRGGKYKLQLVYTYFRSQNYCEVSFEGCRI